MTVYVFLGPTLPLADARSLCDAVFLPPVRLGDVWRAAAFGGATAIGIIDGYFERVPAVWHKEILWALGNGVSVAGAASMGALRAAELAPFGMVGVGRIFEAYRSGVFEPFAGEPFEDDDEVAVVHGPAESGWMASEAMVNIRATLAAAAEAGVIGTACRDRLARLAKRLFYKERSWPTLLHLADEQAAPAAEIEALRSFLPAARIDQKRLDAEALLRFLAARPEHRPDARFRFADTALWRRAMVLPDGGDEARVLTELRLQVARWRREREAALQAMLGASPPALLPDAPAPGAEPQAALLALERRARAGERLGLACEVSPPLLEAAVLARLRRHGEFEALLARATAKQAYVGRARAREAAGGDGADGAVPPEPQLLGWFGARLGEPATDVAELALLLDVDDPDLLLRAIAEEYAYVAAGEPPAG